MRMGRSLYWVLVALLSAFGVLGILSIGAPFLLLGLTLAVLYPYRNQPRVFWAWLLGVVGFIGGYLLIAPLGCTTTAMSRAGTGPPSQSERTAEGRVVCSSVLGLPYSGQAPYEPPVWPAYLAAFGVAFAIAGATRLVLRDRKPPVFPPEPPGGEAISEEGIGQ